MIVNFDHFDKAKKPMLFICNPDNSRKASIASYYGLEIEPHFNDLSYIRLTVNKYIEKEDGEKVVSDCWNYIEENRQIFVENLGYFIITKISGTFNKYLPSCEIEATSCETEFNNHGIALVKGTYPFYKEDDLNNSILVKIMKLCPDWEIGFVSPTIASLYRNFDDLEKSAYSFLMEDGSNAYNYICNFDILNRRINIVDATTEINPTDILITYDNVLKDCKVERASENIYTALKVTGGEDGYLNDNTELSIMGVNPLGNDTIIDLHYYMNTNWMSQELIDALNRWEKEIDTSADSYELIAGQLFTKQQELADLDGKLSDEQTKLKSYKDILDAISTVDTRGYEDVKKNYDDQLVIVNNIQQEITSKQSEINNVNVSLSELQNKLSIDNNFSIDQIKIISKYIKQTSWKDENIISTNSMTWNDRQKQIETLYQRGKNKLAEISQPTVTITIDCLNFVLIKDFQHFRDQFDLGNMIHVEVAPKQIVNFVILAYKINYDSFDFEITISNKLKLHDNYSKTRDLYSNLSASASTLSTNKNTWGYPVKSGTIEKLKNFADNPFNLSKNQIILKDGQDAFIDGSGIHCRKINSDNTIDPRQMVIRHNEIAFTKDNWNTIGSAWGLFQLPDGHYDYGLNAEAIVAGKIYGNMLQLGGSGSNGAAVIKDQNDNDIVLLSNQGIELKNGGKILGKDGLLSSFMFTSGGINSIGIINTGIMAYHFVKKNIKIDYKIPNNFFVSEAYITLILYPSYYSNIYNGVPSEDGTYNIWNGWGYPHDVIIKKSNNLMGLISSYDFGTYENLIDPSFIDITNMSFGLDSLTPNIDSNWNIANPANIHGTKYISNNIASFINLDEGEFIFGIKNFPEYVKGYEDKIACENSGRAIAFLNITGYQK